MGDNQTIIIGVSGPSASGKSLLATTIYKEIGSDQVVVISEDSYYKDQSSLSMEERAQLNYDHPDAFEHDLLVKHLKELKKGKTVQIPIYDFKEHIRSSQTREVGRHRIIVLEGIMLFVEKKLREALDIQIFMDTPLDICLLRRVKRDVIKRKRTIESVLDQYQNTVRPMYLQFI